jgi:YVTN family beta-propeller protein
MMWVASATGLWGVDPATNRVTKTVTLPVGPEFLTYGFNSLWLTNFDAQVVLRVDPASGHVLARIPTAHPQGIVTTAEGVWVANHHEGKVTLIDPATNEAAAAVPVGPTGPSGPQGMAVIDGMIWVGMFNASQVVAVDPATRTVTTTVKDLSAPCGDLAASGSDLWVSECGEQKSVDQVDLSTGTFIRNTWVAGYVGTPIPVTDGVWLPLNGAARLLRMSDVTGQPVDAIGLPDCARDDLSSASVAFGSIWITCGQSLLRLAPSQLP